MRSIASDTPSNILPSGYDTVGLNKEFCYAVCRSSRRCTTSAKMPHSHALRAGALTAAGIQREFSMGAPYSLSLSSESARAGESPIE